MRKVSLHPLLAVLVSSLSGCSGQGERSEPTDTELGAVTPTDPTFVCNQDPRVWMQMVPLEVCVGARLFFDETFGGNGRKCSSCHPVANNFTIDAKFVQELAGSHPDDALFVAESPAFDQGQRVRPSFRPRTFTDRILLRIHQSSVGGG